MSQAANSLPVNGAGGDTEPGKPSLEEQMEMFVSESGNDGALDDKEADDTAKAAAGEEESNAEEESKDGEGDDDTTKGADGQPQRKKSVQERINELRRGKGDSDRALEAERRRVEALEQQIADLKAGKQPPAKEEPAIEVLDITGKPMKEPKAADFKYGEVDSDYIRALAQYTVAEERARTRVVEAKAAEERERAAQQTAYENLRDEMTARGLEVHEDFEEKVIAGATKGTYKVSPAMAQLILESDHGHMVAYHLATNPKLAREIFGKSPLAQAAAFGRLEAQFLSAEKPPQERKAPIVPKQQALPTRSRGSAGQFSTQAETTDFASFEQMARGSQRR